MSSWLCSLLYVHISSDITPQKQVDKQYILQHLVDILLHLIQDLETDNTNIEASKSDVNSDRNLARRAFNVIATLARLYSLGAGLEDDLIPNNERVLSLIGENDDVAMMSDATAVLTRTSLISLSTSTPPCPFPRPLTLSCYPQATHKYYPLSSTPLTLPPPPAPLVSHGKFSTS